MLLQNPQSASSLPGVPESSTGSGRRPNEDLTARSLLSSAPHSQIDTTIVGRSASSTLSSSTAPEAGELLELLPRSQLSLLTHLGELKASGLDGDELGSLTKKVAEVRSFAKGRQRHAAASGDLNSLRDSRDLNSLREQVGLLTEQVNTLQSAPSGVTPSGHAASATSAEEKQLTSMRQQLQGLHLKVQSHEASIDEFVSMRKKLEELSVKMRVGLGAFSDELLSLRKAVDATKSSSQSAGHESLDGEPNSVRVQLQSHMDSVSASKQMLDSRLEAYEGELKSLRSDMLDIRAQALSRQEVSKVFQEEFKHNPCSDYIPNETVVALRRDFQALEASTQQKLSVCNDELSSLRQGSESSAAAVREDLNALNTQIDAHAAAADCKLQELCAQVSAHDSSIEGLQFHSKDVQAVLLSRQDIQDLCKQEMACSSSMSSCASHELEKLHEEICTMTKAQNTAKEGLSQCREEFRSLLKEQAAAQDHDIKSLREELDHARASFPSPQELRDLCQQVAAVDNKMSDGDLASLLASVSALELKQKEISDDLLASKDELKCSIEQLRSGSTESVQQQVCMMTEKIDTQTTASASEMRSLRADIADMRTAVPSFKGVRDLCEQAQDSITSCVNDLASLRTDFSVLEAKHDELGKGLSSSRRDVAELGSKMDPAFASLRGEVTSISAELEAQAATYRSEVKYLRDDLSDVQAKLPSQQQLKQLCIQEGMTSSTGSPSSDDLVTLSADVSALELKQNEISKALAAYREELMLLRKQTDPTVVASLRGELGAISSQVSKHIASADCQLQDLRSQLAINEGDFKRVHGELTAIRSSIPSQHELRNLCRQEIDPKSMAGFVPLDDFSNLRSEVTALEARLVESNVMLSSHSELLMALQSLSDTAATSSVEDELAASNKKISDLSEQLSAHISAFDTHGQDLHIKMSTHNKEIDSLNCKLEAVRADLPTKQQMKEMCKEEVASGASCTLSPISKDLAALRSEIDSLAQDQSKMHHHQGELNISLRKIEDDNKNIMRKQGDMPDVSPLFRDLRGAVQKIGDRVEAGDAQYQELSSKLQAHEKEFGSLCRSVERVSRTLLPSPDQEEAPKQELLDTLRRTMEMRMSEQEEAIKKIAEEIGATRRRVEDGNAGALKEQNEAMVRLRSQVNKVEYQSSDLEKKFGDQQEVLSGLRRMFDTLSTKEGSGGPAAVSPRFTSAAQKSLQAKLDIANLRKQLAAGNPVDVKSMFNDPSASSRTPPAVSPAVTPRQFEDDDMVSPRLQPLFSTRLRAVLDDTKGGARPQKPSAFGAILGKSSSMPVLDRPNQQINEQQQELQKLRDELEALSGQGCGPKEVEDLRRRVIQLHVSGEAQGGSSEEIRALLKQVEAFDAKRRDLDTQQVQLSARVKATENLSKKAPERGANAHATSGESSGEEDDVPETGMDIDLTFSGADASHFVNTPFYQKKAPSSKSSHKPVGKLKLNLEGHKSHLSKQEKQIDSHSDQVQAQINSTQEELKALREGVQAMKSSGFPQTELEELRRKVTQLERINSGGSGSAPTPGMWPQDSQTPRSKQVGALRLDLDCQKESVAKQLQEMDEWCRGVDVNISHVREEIAACFEGLEALRAFGCSRYELNDLRRKVDELVGTTGEILSARPSQDVLHEDTESMRKHVVKFDSALRFWKRRDTTPKEAEPPTELAAPVMPAPPKPPDPGIASLTPRTAHSTSYGGK